MLTNDALPRSRLSPSNIRNARPISRQTIAVVILLAAGLLLFTTAQLFATSMADAELVAVHPMRRAQAAPLWKDDHDVSVVTVYARLAYWAYPHPNLAPDVNLDVIAGANGQDQYLTFEPDRGGFNNIRMQVENLVQIAAATRRVLVLPPSSQWYRLQGLSSLADYYQLDMAARYVRMITMDQYLELIGASIRTATHSPDQIFEFLRHHPDSFTPKWNPSLEALVFQYAGIGERVPSVADFVGNRRPIYYDNDLRSQRNLHFRSDYENGYRLLAVPCTFIYYPTRQWERYGLAILRDGFHYRHDIFDAAASVIHQILRRAGRYNAVHIRRSDFRQQYADKVLEWADLAQNLKKVLDPGMPLYISTDEDIRIDPMFSDFITLFNNTMILNDFLLPDNIHPNWRGMVEQIICSSAERFVGTELSTFTAYIHRLRGYMAADVAPDKHIYYTTDPLTGYTYVDGWRTYRTWMKLGEHDLVEAGGGFWQREYWISWQLS